MRGKPVTPSPAAVVLSTYAKQIGTDPKALVSLGVQALADQIVRWNAPRKLSRV